MKENSTPEEKHLLEDTKERLPSDYKPVVPEPWRFIAIVTLTFLLFSLSANVFQYLHSSQVRFTDRSPYTGLTGGVSQKTFFTNTEWSSDNKSHVDMLWENFHPYTSALVVVSKELSKEMNLYETVAFPWDDKMNLYELEGYHSLHCLVYIYQALRQLEQDLPQTHPMHHLIHCLDALRENTICAADDTLRPSNSGLGGPGTPLSPGRRPQRQCRDWSQLERWAVQHSACFSVFPEGHPDHGTMEEWRNCPEGSPYIPVVEEYFDTHGPQRNAV